MTSEEILEKAALHAWYIDFNPIKEELALLRRQLDDALAENRSLTTATAMPRDAAASAAADIVDLMVDAFLRGLPMASVRSRVEERLRAELATMRGHAGPDPDVAAAAAKIFDLAIAGAEGDDDQQTIRAIARVLAGLERSGRPSDGGSEASP